MNDIKRSLTLNLPPATSPSTDQKNFDLRTPDILRIFSGGDMTPTSNAILEKKKKASEPESYLRTFEPVSEFKLEPNQNNNSQSNYETSALNNSTSSTDNSYQYPAPLPRVDLIMTVDSEEMHTVSSIDSSPRLSPIDMQSQEEAKLELKRRRNREAASRCRRRKLENISKLEDAVRTLKEENHDLSQMLIKLKEEFTSLQQKFIKHRQNGCVIRM